MAGMVTAHYADRIGRRRLSVLTVLLMSVPTVLLGLLPTYAVAGCAAPGALLVRRILQGCTVGGGLPGATVFVCELAPPRRLGLRTDICMGMSNCRLLLGAVAAALASLVWRLPFITGIVFGLCAAYLRRYLPKSPMFEQIRHSKQPFCQLPLAVVLCNYRRQCVFVLALVFAFSATSKIYFQFLPTYLIGQLHFDADLVFRANVIGVVAFVLGMPARGTLGMADTCPIIGFVVVSLACDYVRMLLAGLVSILFPTFICQSGFAFPCSVRTAVFAGIEAAHAGLASARPRFVDPVASIPVRLRRGFDPRCSGAPYAPASRSGVASTGNDRAPAQRATLFTWISAPLSPDLQLGIASR